MYGINIIYRRREVNREMSQSRDFSVSRVGTSAQKMPQIPEDLERSNHGEQKLAGAIDVSPSFVQCPFESILVMGEVVIVERDVKEKVWVMVEVVDGSVMVKNDDMAVFVLDHTLLECSVEKLLV